MSFNPQDIVSAFLGQAAIDSITGKQVPVAVRDIGQLNLPTGRIVACDPFVGTDAAPFTRTVRPGSYPVRLVVADLEGDYRVAYAGVFFSETPAARWELAVPPGAETGRNSQEYEYGVDSGTGCFGDQGAMRRLDTLLKGEKGYWDRVYARMKETYVDTWSWTVEKPSGEEGNIVLFSSGEGDGAYASHFGLDETGEPSCLVTDFYVLGDLEEELEEPASGRWWEFWKR